MIGNKQIKLLFNLSIQIWILTLFGCSTGGYKANGLDYSLQEVQKAVAGSMPAEVGFVSSNGREFYSRPFKQEIAGKESINLIMRGTITGVARPYEVAYEVRTTDEASPVSLAEAFNGGEPYLGEESISKRSLNKIQDELAKRRKNKNIIDDFRAF